MANSTSASSPTASSEGAFLFLDSDSVVPETSSDISHGCNRRKSNSKRQPKSSDLNLKCEICGDQASGFHYGVHACEGCKGFFRRTIRMKLSYRECSNNCNINLKSRNKCQFCRYSKCVKLGMSRDAIRFGRISKVEKKKMISKLTKEKAPKQNIRMSVHLDERLQELTEILVSAFQEKMSVTHVKMNALWNQRNKENSALSTLNTMDDVFMLHCDVDQCTGIYDISSPMSGDTASEEHVESCTVLNSDYEGLDIEKLEATVSANIHPMSSGEVSNANERTPEQEFDIQIEEILDFLESMDYVSDPKSDVLIEKQPETKINFGKELLKEYENVPVTIPNIENVLNNIPAIRRVLDLGKILAQDVKKHALENHRSIGSALVFFMREIHVRVQIELGLGRTLSEVRQGLEEYYSTKAQQSIDIGCKHALGIRLMKALFKSMQNRIVKAVGELTEFAKSIPGFTELSLGDQITLLKFGSFEALFVLLSCTVFQSGSIIPDLNVYITFNFIEKMGQIGTVVLSKMEFAQKLTSLNLSDADLALFLSSIILFSDRPGLIDTDKIEELQTNVLYALEAQLKLHHPNNPYLFPTLLLKTADLRQLVADHVVVTQRLADANSMNDLFHPLVSELLNGR